MLNSTNNVLNKWKNDYITDLTDSNGPTEEELAQIEEFKKKDWIK